MAAGNSDAGQGGFGRDFQLGMSQQPLAQRWNQNCIGDLLPLDRFEESLFVEFIEKADRPAQIEKTHRRTASRVEMQGKRYKAALIPVQPSGNRVVERAQRVGLVVDDTAL